MAEVERLQAEADSFLRGPGEALGRRVEETGRVPPEVWEELRARGFLRLAVPEAFGGFGLRLGEYLPVLEILAGGHGTLRMIVHLANGIWRPLVRAREPGRWIRPLVEGRRWLAFALTEPDAGTGTDIRTAAVREGEVYRLNGRKHLVTFADVADHFLVICRLQGTAGAEGTLALLVPADAPGLQLLPQPPAMGLRGTSHAELVFRDCPVPLDHRLGEEGEGLDVALRGFLDPSRLGIAASAVGLAQRSLELAVERARRRVTFGRPLASRQAIQMLLAEMATLVQAARQLTHWAADRWERDGDAAAAAMAKDYAVQVAQRVTDGALQVFGGIGYLQGSAVERLYRDARALRFEEGTAELLRLTVARRLLDPTGRLRAGERPVLGIAAP
jgi:alkylation response protein AidB-like acyl-CoA dehydrogenase